MNDPLISLLILPDFCWWSRKHLPLPQYVHRSFEALVFKCEQTLCKFSKRYRDHVGKREALREMERYIKQRAMMMAEEDHYKMMFGNGDGWR